ncbi:lysophospholipid acyltransferase family protein [Paractinoplanes durhamensis]|uniref:1-acyl-sn-glycerol-3-phosphate acyltransferase n=1 Tax=Paractinoplanes durhamensis TaxID=113563 RepID=A0ABQ3YQV6_9ACTN|nr:lysophospholipid acyltransferase family protein [Actinoplanes durhamensis]GID99903.1 1-acyl-sn-glycerol-3-phosphate acyltransferase [Actinoplanes durhamensis]
MESSTWRTPTMWRFMLVLGRLLVWPLCRLRVSGDVPAEFRGRAVILAANHVSPFDPIVMTAACHKIGIAPRILATGGIFDAPIAGAAMRAAGHIRVDRGTTRVADALPSAADALAGGAMVLVYPEGRIGLDPWMWPERGKTGVARMAALSGAPVLPVAQWGAHAVLPYDTPNNLLRSLWQAMRHRPVVHVRFGSKPVDLSTVTGTPGARAMQATRLIMEGIDDTLAQLRDGEMELPHIVDETRTQDYTRVRPRPGRTLPPLPAVDPGPSVSPGSAPA